MIVRSYKRVIGTCLLVLICSVFISCGSDEAKVDPVPTIPDEPERTTGIWPISASANPDELASTYGPRVLSGRYDFHRGFDVKIPIGTPVHAILDGMVVRVETGQIGTALERYGNFVVIAHEGTIGAAQRQTVYLHLDKFSVVEGDVVKEGDEIGKSGISGVGINTEHLHFEYHIGANDGKISRLNTRNPLRILPYDHIDSEISAEKFNNILSIKIAEDDKSTDIIRFKVLPLGFEDRIIDFETREGINASDEDINPYAGLNIIPESFVTSSVEYELTLELNGVWNSLTEITIELTDVRDSTTVTAFSF